LALPSRVLPVMLMLPEVAGSPLLKFSKMTALFVAKTETNSLSAIVVVPAAALKKIESLA
jgi:hypothetical protein